MLGFFITVIAVGVGVAGSWSEIRNTRGPKEHRFVVWNLAAAWVVLLGMLGLMFVLPPPWRYVLLVPYFIHLPLAIYRLTTRTLLIREEESAPTRVPPAASTPDPAPAPAATPPPD